MENSSSAVNWRTINKRKQKGEVLRDSITHLAEGADAICYFQWRQSLAGAEKWHSALVPHAGPDPQIFRDATRLGEILEDLREVVGTRVAPSPVALVVDNPSGWALDDTSNPTSAIDYVGEALSWYQALADAGIPADVVPAQETDSWASHRVVVTPALYLVSDERAAALREYVRGGGRLIATYATGLADECDRVHPGGYPGALRDVLGLRIEEIAPLGEGEVDLLDDGSQARVWRDDITSLDEGTEVLVRYATGELQGQPAVTRAKFGEGEAAYVSTSVGRDGVGRLLGRLLPSWGVPVAAAGSAASRALHLVREGHGVRFDFFVNRSDEAVTVVAPGEIAAANLAEEEPGGATIAPEGFLVTRSPA